MERYTLDISGRHMVLTRWAKNDYDCSVRGTFADIIDEIIGEKYDRL